MEASLLQAAKLNDIDEVQRILQQNSQLVNCTNTGGWSALHYACRNGNIRMIRLLIAEFKADTSIKNSQLLLPIHLAAACGHSEVVLVLLEEFGCDSTAVGRVGQSLLHNACQGGNVDLVRTLIRDYRADINARDHKNNMPIHVAAFCGQSEVVLVLLQEFGCDITAVGRFGRSLLHNACQGGNVDLVRTLIRDYRADINARDDENNMPIHVAAACGKSEVVLVLLKEFGCDSTAVGQWGRSLLHCACQGNNVNLVRTLIHDYRANINARDDQNNMPIHVAAACGKSEVVLVLLKEFGCNSTAVGGVGRSLLHSACQGGNVDLVQTLIRDYRADINARDDENNMPIHVAAACGKSEVVLVLLKEFGCDSTAVGGVGRSLLHNACEGGNVDLVRTLIRDYRADINARDNQNNMPIHVAAFNGKSEVVLVLLNEFGCDSTAVGQRGQSVLHNACEGGNVDLVRTLIHDYRADINARDDENDMPIHVAAACGQSDVVSVLVKEFSGAEINSKDNNGRTVLMIASENGHTRITDILIESGACTDLQDDEGSSALMTACKNGHVQTTSHLLDNDADTYLRNNEGRTAFDIAVKNNHAEVLSLFAKLRSKPSYPGILFSDGVKRETLTVTEKTINLEEVGVSLSIPKNALPSTDPPLQFEIQPCFSGPFDVPQNVELVSPAYIVKPSRKVSFRKEVSVKIWHHANLESEEDCEDMVFLSASTTPEYRGDSPVYVFREIKGAKGSFRPGEEQPVGEIALNHFCTLAIGKRKNRDDDDNEESEPKRAKGNLYSARLYKSIGRKAIFCICLNQPKYVDNCNKVIALKYRVAECDLALTTLTENRVTIRDKVHIKTNNANEWVVCFDKEPAVISEDKIIFDDSYMHDVGDSLAMDYPPRIEITIRSSPRSSDSERLLLHVEGLNKECSFTILPEDYAGTPNNKVDTAEIKYAMTELKEEIEKESEPSASALLSTANEMLIIMNTIDKLLQSNDQDHVLTLVTKLEDMKEKSEQLKDEAKLISRYLKIKCDINVFVERANTLAVKMKRVYMANMTHSNTPEWQSAVELFVTNAAYLMKAIRNTLRASKLALTIPNNSLSPQAPPSTPTQPLQGPVTETHTFMDFPPQSSHASPSFSVVQLQPPPKPLTTDNAGAVCRCLYSLSTKWGIIGSFLDIRLSSLEAIKADNDNSDDRLTALVAVWLRRHKPPPTWQALAEAVQEIDSSKAEEIRRKAM